MPPLAPASKLLWVHKTPRSSSLSHSENLERIQVFSQAQRTSRLSKRLRRLQVARQNPAPRPALELDPSCSPQERRAIEFYRDVTTTKIMAQQDDMVFWRDDVLCLTKIHEPFRHLVAAIGASHEVLIAPDAARLNVFALEQSSLAARLLRETTCADSALLVASCVLISAYNLLRCDLANADRSVEAGLRLANSADGWPLRSPCGKQAAYEHWYRSDLVRLLQLLDFRNGHRLWAPDVSFQFEKISLGENILVIEPQCVKGPFVDLDQAIASWKALTDEISKMLRNMAVGAYVDPSSPISQEISRQLGLFNFYWDMYFTSISGSDLEQRLEMLSLRAAAYNIYLLFRSRVVCPDELATDSDPQIHIVRQNIVDISQYVLSARHAGHEVEYFDRFVNRTLWALGLYAFDDSLKRRIASLLQDQMDLPNGLINWLRGTIIIMIGDVEKGRSDAHGLLELVSNRLILHAFHYRELDNIIVLEYSTRRPDGQLELKEHCHRYDLVADPALTPHEIHTTLQQILAGYRMFGKPSLSGFPHGYARPMFYQGKQIPVYPGPGSPASAAWPG